MSAKNAFRYLVWYTAICSCKNAKYVESIIDDSVMTCDKIIDATKSVQQKLLPHLLNILCIGNTFINIF